MHHLWDVLLGASSFAAESVCLMIFCGMTLHIFGVLSFNLSSPLLSPNMVRLVGDPLSSSFSCLTGFSLSNFQSALNKGGEKYTAIISL